MARTGELESPGLGFDMTELFGQGGAD